MNNKTKKRIIMIIIIIVILLFMFIKINTNKNYATFVVANQTSEKKVVKNGLVKEPTNPKKSGYKFLGWYLNDKLFDFDKKIKGNVKLVAKWEKIDEIYYTVKFDSNGGNLINAQKVLEDNYVKVPAIPKKDGYKFLGWYLDGELFDFKLAVYSNIKLIAKWDKNDNTDNNNDTGSSGSKNNGGSSLDGNDSNTSKPKDTIKPQIEQINLRVTTNQIIVGAKVSDNKTKEQDLKISYSLDGINYQISSIFNYLKHNYNYKVYVRVIDLDGNVAVSSKTIKTQLVTKPSGGSITPTDYTNGDVTLLMNPQDFALIYSLDGINYINYPTSGIKITTNSTVYFKYTDLANNYSEIYEYEITNIDSEAPYEYTPTFIKTIDSIKVEGTTTDNVSKADKLVYKYSLDDINYDTNNEFTSLSSNTEYTIYIKVTDELGNERKIITLVKTASISAPTVVLDKTTLTNQSVMATVTYDNKYNLECDITGTYQLCSNKVEIISNRTIKFRVTDGINYSEEVIKVIDYIDKSAPSIFEPSISVTTKGITVSGTTTDNMTSANKLVYKYSLDNGKEQASPTFNNLIAGKEYTVSVNVMDEAMNHTVITKIVKTLDMPKPIINFSITDLTNQDVILTVSYDKLIYKLQCKEGSSEYKDCTSPMTISTNKIIDFKLTDGHNDSEIVQANVNNIDSEAPKDFVPTYSATTQTLTITGTTTDNITNPLNLKYSYSLDGKVYFDNPTINNLKANKLYTIYVKVIDEATNERVVKVDAKTLAIPLPILTVDKSNLTKDNVNIMAAYDSSQFELLCDISGTFEPCSSPLTVTDNKTVSFKLTNGKEVGEISSITITNIDRKKPESFVPTLSATTKKIEVSGSTTDDRSETSKLIYKYSLDSYSYQDSPIFDNLITGNYSVYVKVFDEALNEIIVTKDIALLAVPEPVLSVDKTDINNTGVTVTVTHDSQFKVMCDASGTFSECASPYLISENKTIGFKLSDGVNSGPVVTLTITNIDLEAPASFTPTLTSTFDSIKVEGTTTDNITLPSDLKYSYSLDGINYQSSNIFNNLTNNKEYTIYVKVLDEASNERVVAGNIKTKAAPEVGKISANTTSMTNKPVTLKVTPIIPGFKLEYSTDGSTYSEYKNEVVIASNTTVYFRYSLDGVFGNIKAYTVRNIDTDGTAISFTPNGSDWTHGTSTIVEATDTMGIKELHYAWSNDGLSAPDVIDTPFSSSDTFNVTEDTDGKYLWVKAVDLAGNITTSASKAFKVDKTSPVISIVNNSVNSNKISLAIKATDSTSGIKGYYYSKDNGVTWSTFQGTGLYVFTDLKNSTEYKIKVKAVDNALNEQESNTITITTADLGEVTMALDDDSWAKTKLLNINNEQLAGQTYSYSIDSKITWNPINVKDFSTTIYKNTAVYVKVSDGMNEQISSFDVTKIDPVEPTVDQITSDESLLTMTQIGIKATSHDNGSADEKSGIRGYYYSKDNGETWSENIDKTGQYIFRGLSSKAYVISVKVVDNAGNENIKSIPVATKYKTFAEMILTKNLDGNTEGLIEDHYGNLRYRGAPKDVKNYVTFNNTDWRIIGIFWTTRGYRAKLVQDKVDPTLRDWSMSSNSSKWSNSSIRTYLNGTTAPNFFASISPFERMKIDDYPYYNGAVSKYIVPVQAVYDAEQSGFEVTNDKVSLMYASDFAYGTAPSCGDWIIKDGVKVPRNLQEIMGCKNENWLYDSAYETTSELTMSSKNSDDWDIGGAIGSIYRGFIANTDSTSQGVVRPVVFLKSGTIYESGTGTKEDPYILQ